MKSKFLRRIGARSQVTIPKELVRKLGLEVGDMFEAKEKSGVISLTVMKKRPKQSVSKSNF